MWQREPTEAAEALRCRCSALEHLLPVGSGKLLDTQAFKGTEERGCPVQPSELSPRPGCAGKDWLS